MSPEAASMPAAHPGRVPALDGVRAASILLVIAAHTAPVGPAFLKLNGAVAAMGMSLFFALSGYLITSILYARPNVYEFYVKRLFRIIPAMYLYLAILVVFFGLPVRNALVHMTFLSNYVHFALAEGPVSHLWSLCVEMQFYVAVGFLVLCFGRRSLWLVFPAAVIVTLLRIDAGAGAHTNIKTHLRVDEILSGACIAMLMATVPGAMQRLLSPKAVTVAALAVLLPLWFGSSYGRFGDLMFFRPYFAALIVLVLINCRIGWMNRVLDNPVSRYVANTSYALYIYHPLMISGVMNTGSDYVRYFLKRPVSYALTLGAAHLSTFQWESRWQALARRIVGRKAQDRRGLRPASTTAG